MKLEIPSVAFQFNEATVTVRQEIGFDLADSRIVWRKLIASKVVREDDERAIESAWGDFIPAVTQTIGVEGDLGFPWVTSQSSAEAMGAAYLEFGNRAKIAAKFKTALRDVEKLTPGGEDTTPEKKA